MGQGGPGQLADTEARWEQVEGSKPTGLVGGGEEKRGSQTKGRSGQDPYLVHPPSWPGCRETAEMSLQVLRTAQSDHSARLSIQLSWLNSSK